MTLINQLQHRRLMETSSRPHNFCCLFLRAGTFFLKQATIKNIGMAFCKVISKSPANPNKVTIKMVPCEDEFGYYKDFVESQTSRVYKSANLRFLDLNTALYRLLEVLLEKFHDIDAKNSIAGDIIFYAVALAQSAEIDLHIEDGGGNEPRRAEASVFASEFCMAAKATSSAFIRLHKTPHDRRVKDELTFELAELIDTTRNMAHVDSLHDILAINIQKRGEDDRILLERFIHIQQAPYMQLEIETNTIYPLLYHVPKIPNQAFFTTLLISAGIDITERFVYVDTITEKLYKYARKLMEQEYMSKDSVTRIFRNAFGQQFMKFDVNNKKSLLWPVTRNLVMENFATMWNIKYPMKNYLLNIRTTDDLPRLCHPSTNILQVKVPQPWICDPQLQPNITWGPILPTTPMNYSGPTWATVQNWTVIKPPLPTTSTPVTSTSNQTCDNTSNQICDNGLRVHTKVPELQQASNSVPMNDDCQNEIE
jgi:hypothetical protein